MNDIKKINNTDKKLMYEHALHILLEMHRVSKQELEEEKSTRTFCIISKEFRRESPLLPEHDQFSDKNLNLDRDFKVKNLEKLLKTIDVCTNFINGALERVRGSTEEPTIQEDEIEIRASVMVNYFLDQLM